MSDYCVIDTNVVVAGLITSQPGSPVARVLDGMLGATFPFVISPALLAEYRIVLTRPHLVRLHGLTHEQIDTVLTDLTRHAIVLVPSAHQAAPVRAPDPGDQFLWDLLALRHDLILVTGDKRLLQDEVMRARVISPATLAARLQH